MQFGDTADYKSALPSVAFGESGIPHAFIVGTNGLVWCHGYPNESLDRALEQILAGTFDIVQAKQLETGKRVVEIYTAMVSKPRPDPQAAALGDRILADYSQRWLVPYWLAKAILTETSVRFRDAGLALRATTKAVEMTRQKSSGALAIHARALYVNGRRAEAVETQKQAIAVNRDAADQAELNQQLALYERGLAQSPAPSKK